MAYKGGLTYHDGQCQGFTRPIDLIVDLHESQSVSLVAMNFMQMIGPGGGGDMPGELEVLLSEYGKYFKSAGKVFNDISDQEAKLTFKRFELKLDSTHHARYI
ncbi:hypothetical protein [Sphingobacterium luzhongxinii]|uniref:hypothetical protein n=2 Tax=Sphingobacterium TaxID=28453 RepID=UPI0013D9B0F7|nr:hypothetical protein [Sphingobacterium sp. xlx-73]